LSVVPIWMTGKAVSTVTVQYASAGSDGTLTLGGSSQSLVGLVDEITYSGSNTVENIAALTSQRDNDVAIEINDSITLSEILRTGANNCFLAYVWNNADNTAGSEYIQVVVTRGGNTWTFVGIMQSYNEGLRKGKTVGRLSVQIVDLGSAVANPAYA
jgi:hypothetical protein